ncbi:MAG: DNA translocase FtsK 4TM domain-containing protein [Deltaproteobacteria bacterium]|nr:DNA translocase FtsK 4TM domain-containing protein [Deltaproteobacteria bacterium]MBW2053061.1 DNA translocase FtsK 4TM domain-containing protein [Deltaproteobacteria bacterium]MBW2141673.1 DNA translocase FtsK 4TM domain-containing protein [Deltaproteobacteria bacterium]MBW2323846.1 DNA translocase FtsK 4TM domain-containing protein [Deltaproteobacteria bacterium]
MTREVPGLIFLFLAVITFLSLISFSPEDPSFSRYITAQASKPISNYIGLFGSHFSALLIDVFGLAAYWLVVALLLASWRFFRGKAFNLSWLIILGVFLLLISTSASLSLSENGYKTAPGVFLSGGFLGDILTRVLVHFLNRMGASLIVGALALIGILLTTGLSLIRVTRALVRFFRKALERRRELRLKKKEREERARRLQKMLNKQKGRPKPKIKERAKPVEVKPEAPRQEVFDWMVPEGPYDHPPLDLLDTLEKGQGGMSEESLMASSRLLEKKLADFGIEGKVVEVSSGPVITMFEFEPAPGVKISKVANLADDLAMSMRAMSIRIIAPLPGKAVIGIEIPNPRRELVSLREVIATPAYQESKSLLTLVMGVDIIGRPEVTDLRKMPHLLIAGATGSGKSVGLNAMVLSILYKARPDEVRFLMIDPKRIELAAYNDLPHLLYPVISEPKHANQALKWAVVEMENRYRLLAEKGVRNIEAYNRKVKRELAQPKASGSKKIVISDSRAGEGDGETEAPPQPLPYLVVIIDELADLMMISSRDVEESITRLAQMARAAGIHLILATQRPSVDVLTGIIKANLPTRVSFQVSSRTDSRTILDANGAERLLGDGDMLFLPPGTAKLTRIHGAFVSEDEIKRITAYIKAQQKPEYLEDLKVAQEALENGEGEDDYDEKYDEAVELVTRTGRASISLIQRHLRVGYNRAARMIEVMEREGVVGPADGIKPREILAKSYDS